MKPLLKRIAAWLLMVIGVAAVILCVASQSLHLIPKLGIAVVGYCLWSAGHRIEFHCEPSLYRFALATSAFVVLYGSLRVIISNDQAQFPDQAVAVSAGCFVAAIANSLCAYVLQWFGLHGSKKDSA
jgi:hypothetical protein